MRPWLLLLLAGLPVLADGASEDRVRGVLCELRDQHGFPGATVAWAGPGDALTTLAAGVADPDAATPMSPDARMLAASIGKSFLAAAVVRAAAKGHLTLDTPVARWLGDEDWFRALPNHEALTLRHLLTHTGGLVDHVHTAAFARVFDETRQRRRPPAPEELIALITDSEPLFAPGDGWSYSDTGYLVAARALEAATGRAWTALVEDEFLDPLGLDDTTPSNRRALPRLAPGVTTRDNPFGLPRRTVDAEGRLVWHPAVEDAGGGFASTAGDLARWGRALWSGRVLSEAGFEAMMDGVSIGGDRPGVDYGLGVVIEHDAEHGEVRGHRGWIPGYVSSLRYYPRHDIAIAIQINSDAGMMGDQGAFLRIESRITGAILGPAHARDVTSGR
jgi:D-alanyl-D-alanine carboxypeptidase